MFDGGKVLVRADGGDRAGYGHMMRCLSLAEKLRELGAEIHFAGVFDFGAQQQLSNRGISVHAFADSDDGAAHTSRTIHELGHLSLLLVDHYGIDKSWFDRLDGAVDLKMCIDDNFDRELVCDVLLDQNYISYDNPYSSLVPSTCRFLMGPRFALLRPEFKKARQMLNRRGNLIRRILVNFGASDPTGETRKVLEAFSRTSTGEIELLVLPGPSNPDARALVRDFAGNGRIRFIEPPSDIARLMNEVDIALGAGGSSTWERCCLGLPSVVVQTAENQKSIVGAARSLGFSRVLGKAGDISSESWIPVLTDEIHDSERWAQQSEIGLKLVDGSGVDRVASELVHLLEAKRKGL